MFHYFSHQILHTSLLYKPIHELHHKYSAPFGLAAEHAHLAIRKGHRTSFCTGLDPRDRVCKDLEYASRGPRSFRSVGDSNVGSLSLCISESQRFERSWPKGKSTARQKCEWDHERDQRNETFGLFSDRDRDWYGRSYSPSDNCDRYGV
ncbi:hypothetical protein BGW80DRAFT_1274300 [Lactifluus volemus]|nr:hypothetical protein BGW80DRAFT_1274300 [Lactifluus volemus]